MEQLPGDAAHGPSDRRRIVVYERVSTERQDIARQEAQRERARADHPDRDIDVLQDDGVSAFKVSIFDRPGGTRLCSMVEADEVAAIYVDAQDRLSRGDDVEWVTFRALCDSHGTQLIIDGHELRNDLGGRLEGYLKAWLARQESVEKSHRVRSGKRASAQRGRRNGGPRPYGYRQADGALAQVPQEVFVLRRIRGMVVEEGVSLSEIARRLNAEGIKTVNGARWSQTRLSQTLTNVLYRGAVRHRGDEFPGAHEAVFSHAEWLELQRVLTSRRRGGPGTRGGRPTAGSHVLIGRMFRCECGASMVPRTTRNSQGRVYELYRCLGALSGSTSCKRASVRRQLVDGALEAYFAQCGLTDLETARRSFEQQLERDLMHVTALHAAARKKAADAAASLDRIRADYKAGRIDAQEWRGFQTEIEAERAEAWGEIERFAAREQEIVRKRDTADNEAEALRYLADLRAALTEPIRNAETLGALRSRLSQVFDYFVLRQPCQMEDWAMGPGPVEVQGMWLEPVLREDAFDSIVAARQPAASPR